MPASIFKPHVPGEEYSTQGSSIENKGLVNATFLQMSICRMGRL